MQRLAIIHTCIMENNVRQAYLYNLFEIDFTTGFLKCVGQNLEFPIYIGDKYASNYYNNYPRYSWMALGKNFKMLNFTTAFIKPKKSLISVETIKPTTEVLNYIERGSVIGDFEKPYILLGKGQGYSDYFVYNLNTNKMMTLEWSRDIVDKIVSAVNMNSKTKFYFRPIGYKFDDILNYIKYGN